MITGDPAITWLGDRAVRIEVPASLAAQQLLLPGMSVVVSVNTKPGAPSDEAGILAAKAAPSERVASGGRTQMAQSN